MNFGDAVKRGHALWRLHGLCADHLSFARQVGEGQRHVFVLVYGFESLDVLGLRICHDQFSAFHNQLNIYFARATDRVTGTADLFHVPATIPMKNPTLVPNTATPRCDNMSGMKLGPVSCRRKLRRGAGPVFECTAGLLTPRPNPF